MLNARDSMSFGFTKFKIETRQKVVGAFEAVINSMDGRGSCTVDENRSNVAKALLVALGGISGFLEFDRTKPSVTG
jgi:hypothetical protein